MTVTFEGLEDQLLADVAGDERHRAEAEGGVECDGARRGERAPHFRRRERETHREHQDDQARLEDGDGAERRAQRRACEPKRRGKECQHWEAQRAERSASCGATAAAATRRGRRLGGGWHPSHAAPPRLAAVVSQ